MKSKFGPLVAAGALAVPFATGCGSNDASTASSTGADPAGKGASEFTGAKAPANQHGRIWGDVQVTVTAGKPSNGKPKYSDLTYTFTHHTARTKFLMNWSMKKLRKEFLQEQNADNIHMVTGATYTSQAFEKSLQSAILQAEKK